MCNLNLSRFNANNLNLGSVITGLASYITQETQIAKVTFRILVTRVKTKYYNLQLEELLSSESLNATLSSSVETALTTAKANQAIIENHKASLYEYLQISDTETTVTSTTESSVTTTTTSTVTTVATTTTSTVTTAAPADTTTTTPIAETTEAVETTTSAAALGGVSLMALVVLVLISYIIPY